jgi:hypothetical protein
MDDDYYSIDSILSENQVSCCPLYFICIFTLGLHRKYNVPSRLTFPTWATSTEAASQTYAHRNPFEHASLPMYSSFQIKAQSKIQLPLWLAFILIYSCVTRETSHPLPEMFLCIVTNMAHPLFPAITRISRFHLRSARACGTRSMLRLRV